MSRIGHKEEERLKAIGAKMVIRTSMRSAKHWADQLQSGLDDSQSLPQISRFFEITIRQIQKEAVEQCMQIAQEHIGEAQRVRTVKGIKLGDLSQDAATSIRDEEHGETIAAQAIQTKIRHLIDAMNRQSNESESSLCGTGPAS